MSDEEPAQPSKASTAKREPDAQELKAIDKAVAYCRTRTKPLAYEITKAEGREITIDIPHDDAGGIIAQQRATFGTVSPEFASCMAADVCDIVRSRGEAMPAPDKINAGIAAVAGIEPQNEYEAMLAAQMVGVHSVAMDMLSRAKQAGTTEHLERYGSLATKMLRTYTAQIEALAKLRRGGSQKVMVEHVHVYPGSQAIVGAVTQGGGGYLENGQQPHAPADTSRKPALAAAGGTSLRGADSRRATLPVAGGKREEAVPDARRRKGKRRTGG
jgi:hypothetical protein